MKPIREFARCTLSAVACPRLFIMGLALCQVAGCGPSPGEISGTVTFQGKTLASGTVIIVGSDLLTYYGNIEDDGTYTVAKVPTGPAKIVVFSPPAFRADPKKWFPLPKKYEEFETSGLTLTVTAESVEEPAGHSIGVGV